MGRAASIEKREKIKRLVNSSVVVAYGERWIERRRRSARISQNCSTHFPSLVLIAAAEEPARETAVQRRVDGVNPKGAEVFYLYIEI